MKLLLQVTIYIISLLVITKEQKNLRCCIKILFLLLITLNTWNFLIIWRFTLWSHVHWTREIPISCCRICHVHSTVWVKKVEKKIKSFQTAKIRVLVANNDVKTLTFLFHDPVEENYWVIILFHYSSFHNMKLTIHFFKWFDNVSAGKPTDDKQWSWQKVLHFKRTCVVN